MPVILSVYRSLRRGGPTALMRLLRDRLGSQSYELYRFDLSRRIVDVPGPDGIVIEVGEMRRLRAWVRRQGSGVPAPYTHPSRDPALAFCWALNDGEPISIIWMGIRSPLIRLSSGEAITKNSYTAPQWRGQGIGKAVKAAACRYLQQRGFMAVYTTVRSDNIGSRRIQEALGFTHLGHFTSSVFSRRPATTDWYQGQPVMREA